MPVSISNTSAQSSDTGVQWIELSGDDCAALCDVQCQIGAMIMCFRENCSDNPREFKIGCKDQRNGITLRKTVERTDLPNQCLGSKDRHISYSEFQIEVSIGNVCREDILSIAFNGEADGEGGLLLLADAGGCPTSWQIYLEPINGSAPFHFYNCIEESDSLEIMFKRDEARELTLTFAARAVNGVFGKIPSLG